MHCEVCGSQHVVFVSDAYGFHCSGDCGAATTVRAGDVVIAWVEARDATVKYAITQRHGSYRCSCTGFAMRRKCRHLGEYEKEVA